MSLTLVARFLEAVGAEPTTETVTAAFAQHLAGLTADALPPGATRHWHDIARLLRSPAEKPIPGKAIAAIRSWPTSRVSELTDHIRQMHHVLEKLENERLEDEIRDNIRRHYL